MRVNRERPKKRKTSEHPVLTQKSRQMRKLFRQECPLSKSGTKGDTQSRFEGKSHVVL